MRRRMFEQSPLMRKVDPEIRSVQAEHLEQEIESVERYREEAKKLVAELLRRDFRMLIIDGSQGGLDPEKTGDPDFLEAVAKHQFGRASTDVTHGEIFRHILGFDPDDPRVDLWKVFEDTDRKSLPYPDVWVATGGPAMPSELAPGNETKNTGWLRREVSAMHALSKAGVPGIAVCLGHQLFEHSRGAVVGQRHAQREFGTVKMHKASTHPEDLQLLYGFWDEEGRVDVSASHKEAVITAPEHGNFRVLACNSYSDHQAVLHPSRPDMPVDEAIERDEYVLSIQNHPELMAILLHVLRDLRFEPMKAEGLSPETMVFRDTPQAREVWKQFLHLAAKRQEKKGRRSGNRIRLKK